MAAVSMYHVCSFHKQLQTQLIPFRLGILRERKNLIEMLSHTAYTYIYISIYMYIYADIYICIYIYEYTSFINPTVMEKIGSLQMC